MRELVSNMLESIGFEVIVARDGTEGLEAFASFQKDLTICVIDVTMPGMGGLELVCRIREQDSALPVLLVSGYSHEEVRDGDAKNVSFLQKPFTVDQIRSAIESTG
ncbi:MAG TPA: hypothetical protein DCM54_14720 [Gammaproteobacteria bacterium]|nr:hypothetical protein [Gammaproteobacteria bacterium]